MLEELPEERATQEAGERRNKQLQRRHCTTQRGRHFLLHVEGSAVSRQRTRQRGRRETNRCRRQLQVLAIPRVGLTVNHNLTMAESSTASTPPCTCTNFTWNADVAAETTASSTCNNKPSLAARQTERSSPHPPAWRDRRGRRRSERNSWRLCRGRRGNQDA